jgi:hypothetical protein
VKTKEVSNLLCWYYLFTKRLQKIDSDSELSEPPADLPDSLSDEEVRSDLMLRKYMLNVYQSLRKNQRKSRKKMLPLLKPKAAKLQESQK